MTLIRDSSSIMQGIPSIGPDAGYLTIGIIMEELYDEKSKSFSYSVESIKNGRKFYMKCRPLENSGDIFNYEERGIRGYQPKAGSDSQSPMFSSRPGEIVVVAAIGGIDLDGVIVGYLKHPDRQAKRKAKEFSYYWSYNGVDISVDKDGAYKVGFNGLPTNIKDVTDNKSGVLLPLPKYDEKLMGTFFTVDKEGSFEVNDGAEKFQSIKIDKKNGKIIVTSGEIAISLEKKDKKMSIVCSDITATTDKSIKLKTKDVEIEATGTAKIKSPKIAIGSSGIEILDSIIKIVDAIGMLVINTPQGPCTPVKMAAKWADVEKIKKEIDSIKGSL